MYTAMIISNHLFTKVPIFSFIVTVLIYYNAILMAKNIYEDKISNNRFRNALIELAYCLIILFTINTISDYIGNFYSVILVIIEFLLYIFIINPKFMNRIIVS